MSWRDHPEFRKGVLGGLTLLGLFVLLTYPSGSLPLAVLVVGVLIVPVLGMALRLQEEVGATGAARKPQGDESTDRDRARRQTEERARAQREAERARAQRDAEEKARAQRQAKEEAERQRREEQERSYDADYGKKSWSEVLGVSQHATLEEISRRYREKIRQYHPDRLHGLAPDLLELAERRSKEINRAYAEAKRAAQVLK